MDKKMFYFTFGLGHEQEGYCQPVLAENEEKAREIMRDKYDKWAFQYTEEEYQLYKEEGTMTEKLFDVIQ